MKKYKILEKVYYDTHVLHFNKLNELETKVVKQEKVAYISNKKEEEI